MPSFQRKKDAVRYVERVVKEMEEDFPLIMIINQERSGGYSVSCVTGELSDGIAKNMLNYLKKLIIT